MKANHKALILGLFTLAIIVGGQSASAQQQPRPNIVFILLDNVGQEWFGCYGSEENCTPNIDQLARTGVRVENCYTPPVCGPSRTVLLTGRYPHSTGFRLHHDAALYSGGGLDPKSRNHLPAAPARRRLRHRHHRQVADQQLVRRARRAHAPRLSGTPGLAGEHRLSKNRPGRARKVSRYRPPRVVRRGRGVQPAHRKPLLGSGVPAARASARC